MESVVTFFTVHPELLNAIGVTGFIVYIIGFYLVQAQFICGNSNGFAVSQVLAALLVLISLAGAFNLPSFLIQISYAAIGSFGITRRLWQQKEGFERLAKSRV